MFASKCQVCGKSFETLENTTQIRSGGRRFHNECIHNHPKHTYVMLEKRHLKRDQELAIWVEKNGKKKGRVK